MLLGGLKKLVIFDRVRKRCKVSFFICKYNDDQVYCDVVDMNAYHILFGRPWQHDVDARQE